MANCENFLRAFACSATTRADKELRLIVQKWAQLTCSSLLSALPPPSSASALLGAPPRSTGTEHCMLASNAMRASHWLSATRFRAIFFLGPVVFLLWPSLYMCTSSYTYMYMYLDRTQYRYRCWYRTKPNSSTPTTSSRSLLVFTASHAWILPGVAS